MQNKRAELDLRLSKYSLFEQKNIFIIVTKILNPNFLKVICLSRINQGEIFPHLNLSWFQTADEGLPRSISASDVGNDSVRAAYW